MPHKRAQHQRFAYLSAQARVVGASGGHDFKCLIRRITRFAFHCRAHLHCLPASRRQCKWTCVHARLSSGTSERRSGSFGFVHDLVQKLGQRWPESQSDPASTWCKLLTILTTDASLPSSPQYRAQLEQTSLRSFAPRHIRKIGSFSIASPTAPHSFLAPGQIDCVCAIVLDTCSASS